MPFRDLFIFNDFQMRSFIVILMYFCDFPYFYDFFLMEALPCYYCTLLSNAVCPRGFQLVIPWGIQRHYYQPATFAYVILCSSCVLSCFVLLTLHWNLLMVYLCMHLFYEIPVYFKYFILAFRIYIIFNDLINLLWVHFLNLLKCSNHFILRYHQ